MAVPAILIIGGVVAAAGAVVLAVRAYERKRRAAYEEYCLTRGFGFEPERPDFQLRFEGAVDLFDAGRSRKWGYTIAGTRNGATFTAFEYSWVTSGGKSSHTNYLHGMVWESPEAPLPPFALTPEGVFTRLGGLFGMQDIDFDDAPEFSRAYRLKGRDEPAVRALFTPEIRRFFAATPKQKVTGAGPHLFWWRDGRLPTPERLDEWLEEGDRVRRRFGSEAA